MVIRAEVPFEDAVRMASETPARIMNVIDRVGTLEKGKDADILMLDKQYNITSVWSKGVRIF
jgi:N-acetylglucosamine-6-phosphate deacetylase